MLLKFKIKNQYLRPDALKNSTFGIELLLSKRNEKDADDSYSSAVTVAKQQ